MQNLRDKESQLLSRMLTLVGSSNGPLTNPADFGDQWKVLVYDQDGRDIISPLLNVGALRQKGVTLHLQLHSEREPVPDAPVVYFVRPTEANVKRIAEDCAKQIYRNAYINFISRADRSVLEKFAQELVATNSVSMVSKIYDQYLDVIALEPSLFSLNIKDSFAAYNDPSLKEQQIRGFMNKVALGLLSTVRVMGALPIIRYPPGGAAEMLAREFSSLLHENISTRGPAQALFEDCLVQDRARPLLLIVDRGQDLFPVLQHTSSYQSLVSDLLDVKLNRVTVEIPEKGSSVPKKKTYDLNTQSDHFLRRFASAPFPEAVEHNERELAEIAQLEASLRSKQPSGAATDDAAMFALSQQQQQQHHNRAKDLSEAIESLPEILQRKATLETHTNLMQAVMKQIAARDIPSFFELEQALLTGGVRHMDRAAVLTLLRDGTKGSLHDKARLLALLAALGDSHSLSKVGAEEYDAALTQGCAAMLPAVGANAAAGSGSTTPVPSAGSGQGGPPSPAMIAVTLSAVQFLRRLVSLQQQSGFLGGGGSGGGGFGGAGKKDSGGLLQSFLTSKASSLFAKATSFFTKFTPYYVTRVTHALAEGRLNEEVAHFQRLDPRNNSSASGSGAGGDGSGERYPDVIVFVLGGGSYAEFFNLQELVVREEGAAGSAGAGVSGSGASKEAGNSSGMRTLRSLTYGCTDLVAGDDFLRQIERLNSSTGSS